MTEAEREKIRRASFDEALKVVRAKRKECEVTAGARFAVMVLDNLEGDLEDLRDRRWFPPSPPELARPIPPPPKRPRRDAKRPKRRRRR